MKLVFGKVRKAAELVVSELDDAPTREMRVKLPRGKVVGRDVLFAAGQAAAIVARAEDMPDFMRDRDCDGSTKHHMDQASSHLYNAREITSAYQRLFGVSTIS